MAFTVDRHGERYYILGDSYEWRDELRNAGCRYDPDRREWWIGEKDEAKEIAGRLNLNLRYQQERAEMYRERQSLKVEAEKKRRYQDKTRQLEERLGEMADAMTSADKVNLFSKHGLRVKPQFMFRACLLRLLEHEEDCVVGRQLNERDTSCVPKEERHA